RLERQLVPTEVRLTSTSPSVRRPEAGALASRVHLPLNRVRLVPLDLEGTVHAELTSHQKSTDAFCASESRPAVRWNACPVGTSVLTTDCPSALSSMESLWTTRAQSSMYTSGSTVS